MNYILPVRHLYNSLPFYRALAGGMPLTMDSEQARFDLNGTPLILMEIPTRNPLTLQELQYQMPNATQLNMLYVKMSPFLRDVRAGVGCTLLQDHFQVKDPDGHRWHISTQTTVANERFDDDRCFILPLQAELIN